MYLSPTGQNKSQLNISDRKWFELFYHIPSLKFPVVAFSLLKVSASARLKRHVCFVHEHALVGLKAKTNMKDDDRAADVQLHVAPASWWSSGADLDIMVWDMEWSQATKVVEVFHSSAAFSGNVTWSKEKENNLLLHLLRCHLVILNITDGVGSCRGIILRKWL